MADEAISTFAQEILARDLGLTDFDRNTHTVTSGVTTMKPGMLVTTFGETGTDIDIFADGDEYATGIVLRRKTRKISADGAVADTVDTAFAAADEVVVQYFTGGRAHVYVWVTGMDTGDGDGALRRGAPVYIPDFTAAALVSTNPTVGACMAILKAALDINAAIHPLVQIGWLLEDVTVADSTSAVVGKVVKVAI